MISSEVICDSIGEQSPQLNTQLWIAPKFIHQESLRHRAIYIMDFLRSEFDPDFSFSVSSSRAIPTHKLLAEARTPSLMAKPVLWGLAQPGMSPGDEVDDNYRDVDMEEILRDIGWDDTGPVINRYLTKREAVENLWEIHGEISARIAEAMINHTGIHKSIPNRLIEAHVHVHCLASATQNGWMNFYGLRLDRAADPTLRALAEASWRCWNESKPKLLRPGEWHLPFVDDEYRDQIRESCRFLGRDNSEEFDEDGILLLSREVSVACCAHLSYESFETGRRMTLEQCINLHDRLVKSVPIHASPAEHQATPDKPIITPLGLRADHWSDRGWAHLKQSGNLGPGWRQYRKMLPDEAVAPLPEGYVR